MSGNNSKHSNEAMSGQDLHLPPEIWAQILAILPVKFVLRFRCVCKTWYSLVSCPNFISDHTARTLNRSTRDRMLLRRYYDRSRRSSFSFHDESFVESNFEHHPDVPERLRRTEANIVGSCDGLICLYESYATFLIWNPSLGKVVELPPPPSPFPQTYTNLSGFGFDPESRDYKVVWIEFHKSSDDLIHIFDLRKGTWRSSSPPWPRPRRFGHHSVYLHGNLHFTGKDETSSSYYILMSLNSSSAVLQETEMKLDGGYPLLSLINGLLSVAMVKKHRGDALQEYCSVWSMKEYGVTESWVKLFTIEMPFLRNSIYPLRFWENGEMLFEQGMGVANYKDGGSFLVMYDPESNKSTVLLSANGSTLDACFFKESLVLL